MTRCPPKPRRLEGGVTLRLASLAAACWVALAASAMPASAQQGSIVVLRIDPSAEPICQAVEAALSERPLTPDPGYAEEARRRGLDPTSEQTRAELTPPVGAQLAVIPLGTDDRSLLVEFRDGSSGSSLGEATIPLQGGALGPAGRADLLREVDARLSQPSSEDFDASADGTLEADDEDATRVRLRVFGGLGAGARTLSWDDASGRTLVVETGMFAAFDVGLQLDVELSEDVAIGPVLTYQSSIVDEVEEAHIAGVPESFGIRSHRFEALLALTFGLGDGWSLAPLVGYTVRNLRPDVHHLLTPAYTISGPALRAAFNLGFGDAITLRIAPELQYFVQIGDDLEVLGIGSGLGFGAEAALQVTLTELFALELAYREAHAALSGEGDGASDVERYLTVRLVGGP